MRKYLFLLVAIVAGVVAFAVFSQPGMQKADAKVLNVNEVGADPGAYTGAITITGIMAAVSNQDASIFGIMDIQELQCTMANCNKILIPVKYDGQQPAMGDEVRITGSFIQSGGGYLFTAQEVDVIRNHTLGG